MTSISNVCYIVFLACIAQAWGGKEICNKGPGFWCSNLRNANRCDAVGHCLQTVWLKQIRSLEGISCDTCSDFITEIRAREKDMTNSEILDEYYKSCSKIFVSAKCKQDIEVLGPAIVQIIRSTLSPDQVCYFLELCEKNEVPPKQDSMHQPLLGAEKCTWGPSYWCSNFSTSRNCKATHHCIERVWSKMQVPADTDSVCQICTKMVKQARDQLMSNETQEELKEVFEGSCKLIPIPLVNKECITLVDDFIPELVETLASEMNPTTVCTVAGLCNNVKIDRLMIEYNEKENVEKNLEATKKCFGCRHVVGLMRDNFDKSSYDGVLKSILTGCRQLGSFSDACSYNVFSKYNDIYAGIKENLYPDNVCHLSGMCSVMHHQHGQPSYALDTFKVEENDELTCEFCEQLVKHLRDTLVANTTAEEFYKVLKGICSETGNFKIECKSLVEQWYPVVYNYLVSDLKPKEICSLLGICTHGPKVLNAPIAPLVPRELVIKSELIGQDEANSYKTHKPVVHVPVPSGNANVRVLGAETNEEQVPPLPLERMFVSLPQGKNSCEFCQYFLHYLQVEISDSNNEEKIKGAVEHMCDRLPSQFSDECIQFVDAYGPAVIALLVQEIDPASVCPALGICPSTEPVKKVQINSDHSSCPLCLFAIEQLRNLVKDNKTEQSIKIALDNLCNHLSNKMKTECVDFVETYSDKIIGLMLDDLDAQQVCTYLKLCDSKSADVLGLQKKSLIDKFHDNPMLRSDYNNHRKPVLPVTMLDTALRSNQMIETNEIPDNTKNGVVVKDPKNGGVCVLCEYIMEKLDDEIKDKHNEDEIKKAVHNVCVHLPKSISTQCENFVKKYGDIVIAILVQELEPSQVCAELKLCDKNHIKVLKKEMKETILDCAVCRSSVYVAEKLFGNKDFDVKLLTFTEKTCSIIPAKYFNRCHSMMEIYGESIKNLLTNLSPSTICDAIGMCDRMEGAYVREIENSRH